RAVSGKARAPIAGAAIAHGSTVVAVSDGTGAFAYDADPKNWPVELTVSAGGYGTAHVPIPNAHANTELVDIELNRGSTVTVNLTRTEELPRPLRVTIYPRDRDHRLDQIVASASIEKD